MRWQRDFLCVSLSVLSLAVGAEYSVAVELREFVPSDAETPGWKAGGIADHPGDTLADVRRERWLTVSYKLIPADLSSALILEVSDYGSPDRAKQAWSAQLNIMGPQLRVSEDANVVGKDFGEDCVFWESPTMAIMLFRQDQYLVCVRLLRPGRFGLKPLAQIGALVEAKMLQAVDDSVGDDRLATSKTSPSQETLGERVSAPPDLAIDSFLPDIGDLEGWKPESPAFGGGTHQQYGVFPQEEAGAGYDPPDSSASTLDRITLIVLSFHSLADAEQYFDGRVKERRRDRRSTSDFEAEPYGDDAASFKHDHYWEMLIVWDRFVFRLSQDAYRAADRSNMHVLARQLRLGATAQGRRQYLDLLPTAEEVAPLVPIKFDYTLENPPGEPVWQVDGSTIRINYATSDRKRLYTDDGKVTIDRGSLPHVRLAITRYESAEGAKARFELDVQRSGLDSASRRQNPQWASGVPFLEESFFGNDAVCFYVTSEPERILLWFHRKRYSVVMEDRAGTDFLDDDYRRSLKKPLGTTEHLRRLFTILIRKIDEEASVEPESVEIVETDKQRRSDPPPPSRGLETDEALSGGSVSREEPDVKEIRAEMSSSQASTASSSSIPTASPAEPIADRETHTRSSPAVTGGDSSPASPARPPEKTIAEIVREALGDDFEYVETRAVTGGHFETSLAEDGTFRPFYGNLPPEIVVVRPVDERWGKDVDDWLDMRQKERSAGQDGRASAGKEAVAQSAGLLSSMLGQAVGALNAMEGLIETETPGETFEQVSHFMLGMAAGLGDRAGTIAHWRVERNKLEIGLEHALGMERGELRLKGWTPRRGFYQPLDENRAFFVELGEYR